MRLKFFQVLENIQKENSDRRFGKVIRRGHLGKEASSALFGEIFFVASVLLNIKNASNGNFSFDSVNSYPV